MYICQLSSFWKPTVNDDRYTKRYQIKLGSQILVAQESTQVISYGSLNGFQSIISELIGVWAIIKEINIHLKAQLKEINKF